MAYELRKEDFFKPVDAPIAMARRMPQWPFPDHAHEFSEIVIILAGYGLHITEDQNYPVSKGDIFLIPSHYRHGYRELKDLNLINIYFDQQEVNYPLQDLYTLPGFQAFFKLEPAYRRQHRFQSHLRLDDPELGQVMEIIDRLDHELHEQGRGFRFMSLTHFMHLVGYLSRCYERATTPASRSLINIGEAISHLENHYDQDITLKALARLAHMSQRSFLRVFHKAMGDTPIRYLLRLRLAKATELLQYSPLSITQIAFSVGFKDSNYFTRKFRETHGVSPKGFQRRLKNKSPNG